MQLNWFDSKNTIIWILLHLKAKIYLIDHQFQLDFTKLNNNKLTKIDNFGLFKEYCKQFHSS